MKRWLSWWQLYFSRARDESKEKAPKAEKKQRRNTGENIEVTKK
jgi:hypothetical protein